MRAGEQGTGVHRIGRRTFTVVACVAAFLGCVAPAAHTTPRERRVPYHRERPGNTSNTGPTGTTPSRDVASTSATQLVTDSFAGIVRSAEPFLIAPPDVMMAVGPSSIVEPVNDWIQIYSKTGTTIGSAMLLEDFFGMTSTQCASDPWSVYDAPSGRFFISILAFESSDNSCTPTGASTLYLAVSKSSAPTTTTTASWYRYKVADASDPTDFHDQPKLGVSDDKVIITAEDYVGNNLMGPLVYVLQKSDAVAGTSPRHVSQQFDISRFGLIPARQTSSGSTAYVSTILVNAMTGSPTNQLEVLSITGTPAQSNVSYPAHDVTLGAAPAVPPSGATQPSAVKIDPSDGRPLSAIWQSNTLWMAAVVGCKPSGDPMLRTCMELWRVTTSPFALGDADILSGTSGQYLFFPSVGISQGGDLHVVFGLSSASVNPSVYVTSKPAGSASGAASFGPYQQIVAGTGTYADGFGDNPSRFGDYFAAATDPSTPNDVWVAGESCCGPGGTTDWTTRIARVTLAPPTVTGITPSQGPAAGGTTVTINGSDFQPTSTVFFGATQATTNVTFVSSTQMTADAPPASGTGTVHVTVTNDNGTSTPGPNDLFSYGALFHPLPPARIYSSGSSPLAAGADRDITVTNIGGVTADASAVLVNVEVQNPSVSGYIRVTPAGSPSQTAIQEFTAHQTISNLAAVAVGNAGKITLHLSAGTATVFVDVQGYYGPPGEASGDTYHGITTERIYGTNAPALVAGHDRDICVTAQCNGGFATPSGADGVAINVEVFNPSTAGYIRVTPAGSPSQTAVQEFVAHQTISNLVTAKVGPGGFVTLHLSVGSAYVFVDAGGYYTNDATGVLFHPLPTARIYSSGSSPLVAGADRDITVVGLGGISPVGVDSVVVNVEVQSPSAAGYIRVTPAGSPSQTAVQEFAAGQTVSNLVTVHVGNGGAITLHLSAGNATIFIDVEGYF